MNKDYAKFDEKKPNYIPPATKPGYFSNLPDLLVPSQHVEPEGDPLEKEELELMQTTASPPPTPPEDTPGRAGCHIFREETYYVDPIFEDEEYQRKFVSKLMIYNVAYNIPSLIILLVICTMYSPHLQFYHKRKSDIVIYHFGDWAWAMFGTGGVLFALMIYSVGLFRNSPWIWVGFGCRIFITTLTYSGLMICFHLVFIKMEFENHKDDLYEDVLLHLKENHFHITAEHGDDRTFAEELEEMDYNPRFSPPYLGIVILAIYHGVQVVIVIFKNRYKFQIDDYRVPIFIYAVTFALNPILITLCLNNCFGTQPLGYDLVQCFLACYISLAFLITKPASVKNLLGGKKCPLKEGEFMYALLHYGL